MDKVVEDTCVREPNSVKWFQPHAVLVRGFVIWSMMVFQMKGSNGRKSISQPKCMKEVDMKNVTSSFSTCFIEDFCLE
jgi:hypothetical protein